MENITNEDIRWIQRFENFEKALKKLDKGVKTINSFVKKNPDDEELLDLMKESLIKRFEYTHELAWNVMRDFVQSFGEIKIYGSKDASREAFKAELIKDGHVWMDMIKSRNLTVHTYDEDSADEIYEKIVNEYHPAFLEFQKNMNQLKNMENK